MIAPLRMLRRGAMPHRTSDRHRLAGLLLLAWCAGFPSALGIGIVRGTASTIIVSGGGIAGLIFLIAVGLGCALQVLAFFSMRALVRRSRGAREGSGWAAVGVLAPGGIGVVALNLVLVSGPFLPPFGPVSTVLLCLPYPLAFALLEVRDRAVAVGAGAVALLLAGGVIPVHALQEHLAARAWLSLRPGLDRTLLEAVDWPGGEQAPFTTGPYGVRATVFFPDTNIDGIDEGVVTVAPATSNPCAPAAAIATDDNTPEYDWERIGFVVTGFLRGCAGLQAGEESDSCGAGQGQPDRRQGDPASTPHGRDAAHNGQELSTVSPPR
ncbi:hypothetical protein [Streptomyces sp. CA-106131]|uniref:hypothetical protein n=1 Tax=Streptomyces sp. CA-106131 TaxID=3240045 RepID=UPI003D9393C6